jgi:small subunit ribosomal protein S16
MSVAIRLQRFGKKKTPFYRIVAIDSRKRRDGASLEVVGNFDPSAKEGGVVVKEERIMYWLSKGAQASDTVRTMLTHMGIWGKLKQQAHR